MRFTVRSNWPDPTRSTKPRPAELPAELAHHLRTLRGITTKPICVGFGIGTPAQAAAVGQAADGVIVGSAIVQLVEKHAGSSDLVTKVGDFIAALKEPLRLARSAPVA